MRKQRAFATLTEQEINQVAEWVKGGKYDDVIERVAKPRPEGFGIKVSRSPLQRLWAKTARLERINARIASGQRLTLSEFDAITAGEIADLAEEIHQAILEDTYAQATSGENTPAQLLALQKLADFPERAELRAERADLARQQFEHKLEMDAFRKHIATERLELEKRRVAIAEQKAGNKLVSKNEDHLGPLAKNWDDVSERTRIRIGISKEEAARRTALCDAWKQAHLKPAAPETPSTPGAPNPLNPVQNPNRNRNPNPNLSKSLAVKTPRHHANKTAAPKPAAAIPS